MTHHVFNVLLLESALDGEPVVGREGTRGTEFCHCGTGAVSAAHKSGKSEAFGAAHGRVRACVRLRGSAGGWEQSYVQTKAST